MWVYQTSRLAFLDEWINDLATLAVQIKKVSTNRVQFIPVILPKRIPAIQELKKLSSSKPEAVIPALSEERMLDLMWLWDMATGNGTSVSLLDNEHLEQCVVVIIDQDEVFQVRLSSLVTWGMDEPTKCSMLLHKRMVSMASKRMESTVEGSTEGDGVAPEPVGTDPILLPPVEDNVGENRISLMVNDLGKSGSLTVAQQNRLIGLASSYKKIKNPSGKGTVADVITEPAIANAVDSTLQTLPDKTSVIDKTLLRASIDTMEKEGVRNIQKDVLSAVVNIQRGGIIVRDITTERKDDALSSTTLYKVKLQPVRGSESTLSFELPNVSEAGEFQVNGVKYRLDPQRVDIPIRKEAPFRTSLSSYMAKVFVTRSQKAVSNYGRWIRSKLAKDSMDHENGVVTVLVLNDNVLPQKALCRHYTALAEGIVAMRAHGYHFNFGYIHREETFGKEVLAKLEKDDRIVIASGNDGHLVMDTDGILHSIVKGKETMLSSFPEFISPGWGEGPAEYAELGIYGKGVPVGVAIGMMVGLEKLLKLTKCTHRWVDSGKAVNLESWEYRIRFKDESLVVDKRNIHASLIVGGYMGIKKTTPLYDVSAFNDPGTYGLAMENEGIGRHVGKELHLMVDYFVDPVTKEILEEYNEPTEFVPLLIRAVELLVTDNWTDEMDPVYMRTRGYERFSGFVYSRMLAAVREQRNSPVPGKAKVSIPPREVLAAILADQSVVLVEETNPVHALKEREAVTFTGEGGRSPRTMVARSRVFHKHDVGVISEGTPDSAKVGIRSYRTQNAKFTSMRGMSERYDKKEDGLSSAFSSTALVSPGALNNDPKRINMSSIQWSSEVDCIGGKVMPVRTGGEMIIANRAPDKFAYTAKSAGKIVGLDAGSITLRYDHDIDFKPGRVFESDYKTHYDLNQVIYDVNGKRSAEVVNLKDLVTGKEKNDGANCVLLLTIEGKVVVAEGAYLVTKAIKDGKRAVQCYMAHEGITKDAVISKASAASKKIADVYGKDGVDDVTLPVGTHIGRGAGAVISHKIVTDLKVGHVFKIGDAITWNEGHFARDYANPGGVSLRTGIPTVVCLTEASETYEDSSAISKELAQGLSTSIGKEKTLLIRFDQAINNLVSVGDEIESTSILCTIEESATADIIDEDESLAGLTKLAASVPKAKFTGVIDQVTVVYMGDPAEADESVQRLIKKDNSRRNALRRKLTEPGLPATGEIMNSTFVGGQRVTANTMAVTIVISKDAGMVVGDKLVVDTALKGVPARIIEGGDTMEDGTPIGMYMSYRTISARIMTSPEKYGPYNFACVKLAKTLSDIYFGT